MSVLLTGSSINRVISRRDLWFPEPKIPVGHGQNLILPVLVITLRFSKFLFAMMLTYRQAGGSAGCDVAADPGPRRRSEDADPGQGSTIGGIGIVTIPAAGFASTLAVRIQLAPARDPEFKGLTERTNGFFETSLLPGRSFHSLTDFNSQLGACFSRANGRLMRSPERRPDQACRSCRQLGCAPGCA